jgi:hypothetical protein
MRTWIAGGGALLLLYGLMRLISARWGDPSLIEGVPANNALISGALIAIGVVLLVVAYFMKEKPSEA